ncbi:STAS/SEC14 domain-containing protein [Nibribacter ruber]|uniref:STAS/SEC14 domain-containing protein n=1 Tax=Nibribacter ruber TaxID=2698458 RepID=A0A6P1NZ51_9BACT|nr:STAS/SEC14 domain-containing protein [Nibribacter ruber]QHL87258.1 STAS/SEC14 domain-containing protein [Nibribacter ruber]
MKKELTNALGRVFLTVEYDEKANWVYNNWIGYQSYESIVAGANACAEILQQHNCSFLLNDNRQIIGPWNHAVEWIATDWTPRAIAAGLRYFAHVVDADSLAKLSSEEMKQTADGFAMQIFGDIEEATAWLKSHQLEYEQS